MRRLVVAALALPLAGCGGGSGDHAAAPEPTRASRTITVASPAFADGERIPDRYTCHGDGVSPPLRWSGVPADSSVALVVDDPEPGGDYVHWVVLGISPTLGRIDPGTPPPDAQEVDGTGGPGWTAPCPPSGTHHYRFTVYALPANEKFSVQGGSATDFVAAIADQAVAWGRLTGTVSAR
jgi:Raf kinase inhibitor-like YbhB/YbcL family protein